MNGDFENKLLGYFVGNWLIVIFLILFGRFWIIIKGIFFIWVLFCVLIVVVEIFDDGEFWLLFDKGGVVLGEIVGGGFVDGGELFDDIDDGDDNDGVVVGELFDECGWGKGELNNVLVGIVLCIILRIL